MNGRVTCALVWLQQPLKRVPAAVLWAVAVAIATYPLLVATANNALDSAWVLGLGLGHIQHFQWGVDTLFTYGPYGYLTFPIYFLPRTWLFTAGAQIAAHLLLMGSVTMFLWCARAPRWVWATTAGALVLASATAGLDSKMVLGGAILLALVVSGRLGRRMQLAAAITAGAALALVSLIKATALVLAVVIILLAIAVSVRNRASLRRVLLAAGAYVVALCALWLAAHQGLSNIGPYLRGTLEVSRGYSSAMAIDGADGITLVGVLIVLCVAVIAVEGWRSRLHDLARTAVLLFPIAAVNFKEGFVRYDGHQYIFFSNLIMVGAVLLAELARQFHSWKLTAQRSALLGVIIVTSTVVLWSSGIQALQLRWQLAGAQWGTAASLLVQPSERAVQAEQSMAFFRSATPISTALLDIVGKHRVDVIPWDIGVAYSYGLTWAPRPVLQSYSAYTPYLDGLDAAYFQGPRRPDYILYRFEGIDLRYPVFDEPRALQAILAGYRVRTVDGDWLLFERREGGTAPMVSTEVGGVACAPLGRPIPVPQVSGGQLYARVSVKYNVLGRLADLLFKPGEVHIQFATDSGATPAYRFAHELGEDGLLVSGYAGNLAEAGDLFNGKVAHPVRSLTITAQWHQEYSQEVCASFYSIAG
jgi:hypothetical protein